MAAMATETSFKQTWNTVTYRRHFTSLRTGQRFQIEVLDGNSGTSWWDVKRHVNVRMGKIADGRADTKDEAMRDAYEAMVRWDEAAEEAPR